MTVSLNKIMLPRRPDYGAVELKMQIDSNTKMAFLVMLAFVLLLFVSKMAIGSDDIGEAKFHYPPISNMVIDVYISDDPEALEEELFPPEVPEVKLEGLIAEKIGVPIPAEEGLDPDVFVDWENIDQATPEFGDGPEEDPFPLAKIETNTEEPPEISDVVQEEEDPRTVYERVDEEAVVDLEKLQKSIKYPDIALKSDIEGRVIISIWIDENGIPSKAKVIRSDSEILNKAAQEALLKMVCTPAIRDNKAVGSWVVVPITFKLRE